MWWLLAVWFCFLINWLSISFMVGKLAGWLIYLPALPNWVSIFQNSIGGSRTLSVTLQDHICPVAWFSICMKCLLHSVWTILYPGLHFKSHLPGSLFLKYTWWKSTCYTISIPSESYKLEQLLRSQMKTGAQKNKIPMNYKTWSLIFYIIVDHGSSWFVDIVNSSA